MSVEAGVTAGVEPMRLTVGIDRFGAQSAPRSVVFDGCGITATHVADTVRGLL